MDTLIFEPDPSFVLTLHQTWSRQWLLARSRHAPYAVRLQVRRAQPADSGVRPAAASVLSADEAFRSRRTQMAREAMAAVVIAIAAFTVSAVTALSGGAVAAAPPL